MSQKIGLVVDINVYIDALVENNKNAQTCFYLIKQRQDFVLVVSDYIKEKTDKLLKKEFEGNQNLLDQALQRYDTLLENFEALGRLDYSPTHAFSSDATTIYDLKNDDSHIYKLGYLNSPSIIITSDHHFNNVRNRDRSIAIMSPKEFIKSASPKKPPKPALGMQFMNPLDFQPGREQDFGREI